MKHFYVQFRRTQIRKCNEELKKQRLRKRGKPERRDGSFNFLARPPPEGEEESEVTSLTKNTKANPPSPSCLTILNRFSLIQMSPPPLTASYRAFNPEKEQPISPFSERKAYRLEGIENCLNVIDGRGNEIRPD